jgi:hypothetical protein
MIDFLLDSSYILPGFITWITRISTLCLHPLHVPLHAPESITCCKCSPLSIGSGPGQRQPHSDLCVTPQALLACGARGKQCCCLATAAAAASPQLLLLLRGKLRGWLQIQLFPLRRLDVSGWPIQTGKSLCTLFFLPNSLEFRRLQNHFASYLGLRLDLVCKTIFQRVAIGPAYRWGGCQPQVLAQLKSSRADGGWDKRCLEYPGCHC